MRLSPSLAVAVAIAAVLASTSAPGRAPAPATGSAARPASVPTAPPAAEGDQRTPKLRVRTVQRGLDIPWDLTFLPGGAMLYTQRERLSIRYRKPGGADRSVRFARRGMWASGETGLMSILAGKRFNRTRTFFTCHGNDSPQASGHDVRVVKWRLRQSNRRAVRVRSLVKGLPASSGRHGGCRLRYGPEGALYIGTGDAAISRNPQSLRSGGGKVLRVKPRNGKPWPGNPFIRRDRPITRKIYTYGHRNVQGLAQRPGGGIWSVEHGPDRDDEVNRLRKGGNYGWDPGGPGYDESVPMTDFSLPGKQIGARWKSGSPTLATSGAVWLRGKKWGVWRGALAVAALKDTSLTILKFTDTGKLRRTWTPPALNGRYRLRTPVLGPDRNLYVTTANGGGTDRIFKVRPLRR